METALELVGIVSGISIYYDAYAGEGIYIRIPPGHSSIPSEVLAWCNEHYQECRTLYAIRWGRSEDFSYEALQSVICGNLGDEDDKNKARVKAKVAPLLENGKDAAKCGECFPSALLDAFSEEPPTNIIYFAQMQAPPYLVKIGIAKNLTTLPKRLVRVESWGAKLIAVLPNQSLKAEWALHSSLAPIRVNVGRARPGQWPQHPEIEWFAPKGNLFLEAANRGAFAPIGFHCVDPIVYGKWNLHCECVSGCGYKKDDYCFILDLDSEN